MPFWGMGQRRQQAKNDPVAPTPPSDHGTRPPPLCDVTVQSLVVPKPDSDMWFARTHELQQARAQGGLRVQGPLQCGRRVVSQEALSPPGEFLRLITSYRCKDLDMIQSPGVLFLF